MPLGDGHPTQLFAGIFPSDTSEHDKLAESIDRLTLNDNSVTIQKETRSVVLCGLDQSRLGLAGRTRAGWAGRPQSRS